MPARPSTHSAPRKRSEKKSAEKRHHNSVSFLLHKSLFSKGPCAKRKYVGDENPGFGKRAGSPACGGGVQEKEHCAKRKNFFEAHWKENSTWFGLKDFTFCIQQTYARSLATKRAFRQANPSHSQGKPDQARPSQARPAKAEVSQAGSGKPGQAREPAKPQGIRSCEQNCLGRGCQGIPKYYGASQS